ncbi:conserved Plasmodium protein, unknown function [Plasmodium sp. DRC-Itaito]|nr:conserved Plasmodium protein, unknown function [Plasmodium sp. DRC-Itaito]
MIKNELDYLKYIICDIFGSCCSDIVEIILLYGNKLSIYELINLSSYEFNVVRNVLLCLLIHNIVDVNIIYSKSIECHHLSPEETRGVVNMDDNNKTYNDNNNNNSKTYNDNNNNNKTYHDNNNNNNNKTYHNNHNKMTYLFKVGKNKKKNICSHYKHNEEIKTIPDMQNEEMQSFNFLCNSKNYEYMKRCKCDSCICKIRRVEYFVIIKNIYILVRYPSILYYIHPTCIIKDKKSISSTNNLSTISSDIHVDMNNYNFFNSEMIDEFESITNSYDDNNSNIMKNNNMQRDKKNSVHNNNHINHNKHNDNNNNNNNSDNYNDNYNNNNSDNYNDNYNYYYLYNTNQDKDDPPFLNSTGHAQKKENFQFIKKIILIRIIKNGRMTINKCIENLNNDDYAEVCKKDVPEINKNYLRFLFLELLRKRFIKKCKYFNEHDCENDKRQQYDVFKNDNYKKIYTNNIITERSNDIQMEQNAHIDETSMLLNNHTNNNNNNNNNNNHNYDNYYNCNYLNDINREIQTDNYPFNHMNPNEDPHNMKKKYNKNSISNKKKKHIEKDEICHNTDILKNNLKRRKVDDDIIIITEQENYIPNNITTQHKRKELKAVLYNDDSNIKTNKSIKTYNEYNINGIYKNNDNLLKFIDNKYTYFQVDTDTLSIIYLKQECFNFISHFFNLNEVSKCIFFVLLYNVKFVYSQEQNYYKDTSLFLSFEYIEKCVINKLKRNKNIFVDKHVVLQNLNSLIKLPDQLIQIKCNQVITYAADFFNIKNIYKKKIISNVLENMTGLEALRIWKYLLTNSEEKMNDELISENVLIPLNDVRKKLYHLLYHGYIKAHEYNNSNNNKTYIKHSLSFSTDFFFTSNKVKENLYTIAKNIYIRKFLENNEINTLHNKSNICMNETQNHNKKKKITLTSKEYAVDYLEMALINMDKLIFIFSS